MTTGSPRRRWPLQMRKQLLCSRQRGSQLYQHAPFHNGRAQRLSQPEIVERVRLHWSEKYKRFFCSMRNTDGKNGKPATIHLAPLFQDCQLMIHFIRSLFTIGFPSPKKDTTLFIKPIPRLVSFALLLSLSLFTCPPYCYPLLDNGGTFLLIYCFLSLVPSYIPNSKTLPSIFISFFFFFFLY